MKRIVLRPSVNCILLFWTCCMSGISLHAQVPLLGQIYVTSNLDSLKKTLPQVSGIARLNTLLSLEKSTILWETQGSQTYIDQIKNELKAFPDAQGHYWYFKAKQEGIKNNLTQAFTDSKAAYEYYKTKHDSTGIMSALLNMGLTVRGREINSPQKTQFGHQYLKEAMVLSKNSSNVELQILYVYALSRFIGREIFAKQGNQLISELNKAQALIEKYPQYIYYKPFLLNILAMLYEHKQQYQQAQQYTLEMVNIFKQHGRTAPLASLYNVAFFYEMQQKYEQALRSYQEAMKVTHSPGRRAFKFQMDISAGIHASLVSLKRYQEAAVWADSIYVYAEKSNLLDVQEKLQEAVVAYEVEKKETRNQLLAKEKQLVESRSKLYLSLAALAILGLLTIAFFAYRLRRANVKLQSALEDVQQLNQARDYFIGVIAHDLRRPLSSFQDMAEMINYYLTSKKYDELEKVSHSIDLMGKQIRLLIDNLLTWALSQKEEVPYHPEKILLREKICSVVELYQLTAQYQQVSIKVDCPETIEVYIDPNAVELIIRNLVDNALKHSTKGGEIILKAIVEEGGKLVRMAIEDNGKGMSPEKLVEVNETLQHPDLNSKRPRGMGMILVGRFIKSNRATIQVDSILKKGTTFSLTIPV